MNHDTKPMLVFSKWETFLDWLMPTLEKFPKKIRFTMVLRIQNLALDVVEDLIEARYSKQKLAILRKCNLRLEKIRILLRLCHNWQYLANRQYEFAMRELHEVGKLVGGWIRSQKQA